MSGGDFLNIYDIKVRNIMGIEKKLEEYKGKVILIVNTASKCGFTPQYRGLEELYEKYHKSGFTVLAFPSNDFLNQEPGTNEEINNFCSVMFNIKFPLFEKLHVKGREQHPLYKYLSEGDENSKFKGKVKWNFTKFLIDQEGNIVGRYDPKVEPKNIAPVIEDLLAETGGLAEDFQF